VGLRHHVVNYDIQHRSGCKGERKRQYAARERYGKVAEKHTGYLDSAAYKRNYRRTLFARSGFQKRRYDYHGLRDVLKCDAACYRHGVGEVSRSEAHPGGDALGKVVYRNGRDEQKRVPACLVIAVCHAHASGKPRADDVYAA